ncbi:MAG: protein-L-isoaspartate(D-aspartate) O-methyltransferase [Leptospira sp.]|nr:protein-L-isoaspartate(D-aspartate) O-methyltransferase [Leptospira sp.]
MTASKKKILMLALCLNLGVCLQSVHCKNLESTSMKEEREAMVRIFIQRGIQSDVVLNAFRKVPREWFVPEESQKFAYNDHPISIGHGQTISQPFIVAYMTQTLGESVYGKILEIGFGSGYQTAILSQLSKEIYSIEYVPELYKYGKKNLSRMNATNIHLKLGDGRKGWVENAPFDAILVAAAPESIPLELIQQLREGGRMVIPVGGKFNQILYTYTKKNGKLQELDRVDVRFVPLVGN